MGKYEEEFKSVIDFFKNKKVENILVILLFLATLFVGVNIRVQPIVNGNLIDKTTGNYTPLALDPYYFLRVSEILIENHGHLPAVDVMRYGGLNPGWTNEILPKATVVIYDIMKLFNHNATLSLADVLNPVVFFALGLIIFFLLVWILSKNKWVAALSSIILTVIPPYLYRTLAGFSDHDSIGMFGFFLALLAFSLGMFYLERKKMNLYF